MTQRNVTGLLPPVYTTPAQIRAIPNSLWESWVENDSLPWQKFSVERHCQQTLRTILKTTRRRLEVA